METKPRRYGFAPDFAVLDEIYSTAKSDCDHAAGKISMVLGDEGVSYKVYCESCGRLMFMDETAARFTGWLTDEIKERLMQELTAEEKQQRRAASFNEWMRRYTEEPHRFEAEFKTVSRFLTEVKSGEPPTYGDNCVKYLEQIESELFPVPVTA